MINDPALGRTKAQRALGENAPGRMNQFRFANPGAFATVKPTYGRYNVSEQAQDVLNRSLNKKTR